MKKPILMAAAALAAGCLFAQGAERPGPGGGREGRGPGQGMIRKAPGARMMAQGADAGSWLAGFLARKENLEKLGVTNAADRVRIVDGLAKLRAKSEELERDIRKISREQSGMLREILADRKSDGSKLLAKVDEVSRLRAEQGRLAVKSIMLVRDALPEGKESEALEMLSEFGKKRGMMRMRNRGKEAPDGDMERGPENGMERRRGPQNGEGRRGGMRGGEKRGGRGRPGGAGMGGGRREGGIQPPPPEQGGAGAPPPSPEADGDGEVED